MEERERDFYPRERGFGESIVENWKIKELECDRQCVVKDSQEKKKKKVCGKRFRGEKKEKSNFLMAVPNGHTFTPFSPFLGEWESGLLP